MLSIMKRPGRLAIAGPGVVFLVVVAARGSGGVSAAPPTTTITSSTSTPTAASTPASTTTSTSTSTSAAAPSCAALAAHTFVHLNTVTARPDDSLSIVGNPTTLVCGGPDDSHFDTDATRVVMGSVVASASVQVFPISSTAPQVIPNTQLATYLATDGDTGIFLVTGPLAGITSLQEQYHP